MNPEEKNDPVWNLLDQARTREASPAFVRNVVREVRVLGAGARESTGAFGLLGFLSGSRSRLGWSSAALATLVAGAFAVHALVQVPPPGNPSTVVQGVAPAETPVYANLALDLIPVSAPSSENAPSLEAFEAELSDLDYLGELLAVQDTVLLSDEEIARMLY